MQREELRQRIQYLVEHGGAYPDEPCPKDKPARAVLWLLVLIAVVEVIQIFHLLR